MGATLNQPMAPKLDAEGLERGLGFVGLLWASETSIIGSGWLFGALSAAVIAGPAAIFGWIFASIIVAVLALIHAELGGLFPVSGGTSRFPHYAFGSFAGATFGWASYLQAATVAPIEVLAVIQYTSTASFAKSWYTPHTVGPGTLSGVGILVALILLVVFVFLNLVGIRWLAKVSNAITVWKVFIPVLAIVILVLGHFHASNFGSGGGGFFVHTGVIKSILLTLPAGIVFSLLGFEQAVQLAGEAENPQRDLAKAVIVSVIIGAVVYILVQVAFLGAMSPSLLASQHGWTGLGPTNANPEVVKLNAGPFFTVSSLAGIAWLATILRIDAVVSPAGTGLMYTTSAARLSFGLSRNGFLPAIFEAVDSRTRVPWFSIVIAAVVGALFLLPFPSWSELVAVVTSASVPDVRRGAAVTDGDAQDQAGPAASLQDERGRDPRPAGLHRRLLDHHVLRLADAHHAGGGDAARLPADLALLRVQGEPARSEDGLGECALDLGLLHRHARDLLLRRLWSRRDHRWDRAVQERALRRWQRRPDPGWDACRHHGLGARHLLLGDQRAAA